MFGRTLGDFPPALIHKSKPAKEWVVTPEYRERTLAIKRELDDRRWSQRSKNLDDLQVGTSGSIQNLQLMGI